ncbi:MAG: hypothetical protein LBL20_04350, partial [Treponema sp.]|nr:hypothetical protein [Treponema sp.]
MKNVRMKVFRSKFRQFSVYLVKSERTPQKFFWGPAGGMDAAVSIAIRRWRIAMEFAAGPAWMLAAVVHEFLPRK